MGRLGDRVDKVLMLAVGVLLGILGWSLQHNITWIERLTTAAEKRISGAESAIHSLDKRIVALENRRR